MKRLFLFSFFVICFLISFSQRIQYPNSITDGQYYTVNGAMLWVVTVGKGEPLILIAGVPCTTNTLHLKTAHEENQEYCLLKLESHVRKYFDVEEIAYKWPFAVRSYS